MSRYKQWPMTIGIIYGLFVLLLVAFVIFSGFQKVDLVTEDYYDQEIKYQQQINRIERAQSLSEPLNWVYDKRKESLTVQFPPELDPVKVSGKLLFFRPSDAKQDKLVGLKLSADGTQVISTKNLTPGYWKIKFFWQVENNEYYKEGILVVE